MSRACYRTAATEKKPRNAVPDKTDTGSIPVTSRTGKTLPPIPPLPSYQEQVAERFRMQVLRRRR